MKKTYEKPVVHIETFELSQYIASCDFNVRGDNSIESCYAVGSDPDYGSDKIFMTAGVCEVQAEEYCYGNMMGATPVFTSY